MGRASRLPLLLGLLVVVVGSLLFALAPPPAPDPATEAGSRDEALRGEAPRTTELGGRGARAPDRMPEADAQDADTIAREGSGTLVVEVRTEEGLALAGAEVFLVVEDRVEGPKITNEEGGGVTFVVGAAPAELFARAKGRPLHRDVLPAGTRRHEVVLRAGLGIAGRVRAGETAPRDSIALSLTATSVEGVPVPNILRSRLESAAPSALTDATGRFAFTGLPEGWEGYLALRTRDYVLLNPEGNGIHLLVRAPRDDLVLDLHRLPLLTGRVVTAAEERAVAGARVTLVMQSAEGGSSMLAVADGEGRFRFAVMPSYGVNEFGVLNLRRRIVDPKSARIEFTGASGLGRRERVLRPEVLRKDHDLGDLRLGDVWVVRLHVVDAAGHAVPGSVAVGLGGGVASPPTDADGRTSLRLDETTESIQVGAWGYGAVTLPTPRETDAPTRVVLAEGNRLRVQVRSPSGKVPRRVRLRLTGREDFFPGRHGNMAPVYARVGATSGGRVSWPGPLELFYRPDAEGEVRLAGFLPDRPFRVEALDDVSGNVLASEELHMGEHEDRQLVLLVPGEDREIAGVVLGPDGQGMRAHVVVTPHEEAPRARSLTKVTGSDGSFHFDGLRMESVDVHVQAKGHVPLVREGVALDEAARELRLALEPGRRVTVHLVDASGSPLKNRPVTAWRGDVEFEFDYSASHEEDGEYVFDTLPPGVVLFRVEVAGRTFTFEHEATEPEARLSLPALGAVRVRGTRPTDERRLHRVTLIPLGEEGHAVSARLRGMTGEPSWEVGVPYVLPGRYELHLEVTDERDDMPWRTLHSGPIVQVVAGKEQVVDW